MTTNTLYYGDNLDILRRYIQTESVDLIYLDPPFNSNASYNVLFSEHDGAKSAAQLQAFKDTWSWAEASATFEQLTEEPGPIGETLQAFGKLLKKGGLLAYLVMMAPRLSELHRVLKPTGSLYLHCDPTASHYLKVLLDAVFGPSSFKTEIIWKRSSAHSDTKQGRKQHGRIHDVILFYTKGDVWTWNPVYTSYDVDYIDDFYRYVEPETGRRYRLGDLTGPGGAAKGNPQYEVMGVTRYWRYSKEKMQELIRQGRVIQTKPGTVPAYKRYLDEMPGIPIQDLWTDIKPIGAQAKERLDYPTQKPQALLERIISTSCPENGVVLDPFCGCGTTIAAAENLGRRWIGIDITQAAIVTIKKRLSSPPGSEPNFIVVGEPVSVPDAAALAAQDPYQFQWWSLGLVGARPAERKKGADQGIDGKLPFRETPGGDVKHVIFSVKAGHTNVAHVRDLRGVIQREKAEIGVLITLQDPTGPMRAEAGSAGFYTSPWGKHPRLQILTVAELMAGKKVDMPQAQGINITFKQAPKAKGRAKQHQQMSLDMPDEEA